MSKILTTVLLAGSLAACGSPAPFDPCTVQPTKQAADGTWVEWDDEPLDLDPCDGDNFVMDGNGRLTSKRKTTKKPTVTVTTKPPTPKVSRR